MEGDVIELLVQSSALASGIVYEGWRQTSAMHYVKRQVRATLYCRSSNGICSRVMAFPLVLEQRRNKGVKSRRMSCIAAGAIWT